MYRLIKPDIDLFSKYIAFRDEIRDSSNGVKNVPDISKMDPSEFIRKNKIKSDSQSEFWLVSDGDIVGVGSIKHYLMNEFSGCKGHINYIIRPSKQGVGWGTVILQLLVNEAARLGIKSVLIVCDERNLSVAKVIKKAGGVFIGCESSQRKFLVDTGLDYEYWEDPNFKFITINEIHGDFDVFLSLDKHIREDPKRGWCPSYKYDIRLTETLERVGYVDIRIGKSEVVYYAGNIGYNIDERHRGNHYAGKGCILIKRLAIEHNMKALHITANPENIPSRKTCCWIGGKLLEIVRIPRHNEQYSYGDRYKCRYLWDITI